MRSTAFAYQARLQLNIRLQVTDAGILQSSQTTS